MMTIESLILKGHMKVIKEARTGDGDSDWRQDWLTK